MPKITIHHPDGSQVKYGLNGKAFTIGRAQNNDIVLPGGSSSNFHAILKLAEGGDFIVTDLESTNHTKVNNKIVSSALLQDGDTVLFGDMMAVYESDVPRAVMSDPPTQLYERQSPPAAAPSSMPAAPPANASSAVGGAAWQRPPTPQRPEESAPRRVSAGDSGGCFSAFAAILVAIVAFVVGCWIRHAQEHDGEGLPAYLQNLGTPKPLNTAGK